MKTIEEKAKAYDNAIEIAKSKWRYKNKHCFVDVTELFPELQESEDEKIMKALIEYFNEQCDMSDWNGVYGYQVVKWLEKVGEDYRFLKSIKVGDILTKSPDGILINLGQSDRALEHYDKVKPTFNVGDCIIWDNKVICYIDNIYQGKESLMYTIVDTNGFVSSYATTYFEKNARLWTIHDAKDGDVLTESKRNVILIFKGIGNTEWDDVIDYYCYYDCYRKDFIVQKDVEYWGTVNNSKLKPATKEQRDAIFERMREAGYTWNGKKKELKKIEQKPMLSDFFNAEYERGKADALKFIKWSEEDKSMYIRTLGILGKCYMGELPDKVEDELNWLKTLKERIGE